MHDKYKHHLSVGIDPELHYERNRPFTISPCHPIKHRSILFELKLHQRVEHYHNGLKFINIHLRFSRNPDINSHHIIAEISNNKGTKSSPNMSKFNRVP